MARELQFDLHEGRNIQWMNRSFRRPVTNSSVCCTIWKWPNNFFQKESVELMDATIDERHDAVLRSSPTSAYGQGSPADTKKLFSGQGTQNPLHRASYTPTSEKLMQDLSGPRRKASTTISAGLRL